MVGILIFLAGVVLALYGNYGYQRLIDYAGLMMIGFGLVVMLISFSLYRTLR